LVKSGQVVLKVHSGWRVPTGQLQTHTMPLITRVPPFWQTGAVSRLQGFGVVAALMGVSVTAGWPKASGLQALVGVRWQRAHQIV
jgi:hypothetical protein